MKNQKNPQKSLVVKRVTKKKGYKSKHLTKCEGGSCSRKISKQNKERGYFDALANWNKQKNESISESSESFSSVSNSFKEELIKNNNDKSLVARRGLMIGINYTGSSNALNGCINDCENLKQFLTSKNYFKSNELIMMNDNQSGGLYPTKANILNQFRELVKFANANKGKQIEMFISYSGHGHHIKDTSGDEADGQDEVLCPVDFSSAGFIVDDQIRADLIDKLPSNVKLLMIVDACHSGTMGDLRYAYKVDSSNAYTVFGNYKDTKCKCVLISGCRDDQTSADAYVRDDIQKRMEYQGAMSASLIKNYSDGITYNDLINKMRSWLRNNRYTQVPQLSSGKLININDKFILSEF